MLIVALQSLLVFLDALIDQLDIWEHFVRIGALNVACRLLSATISLILRIGGACVLVVVLLAVVMLILVLLLLLLLVLLVCSARAVVLTIPITRKEGWICFIAAAM